MHTDQIAVCQQAQAGTPLATLAVKLHQCVPGKDALVTLVAYVMSVVQISHEMQLHEMYMKLALLATRVC